MSGPSAESGRNGPIRAVRTIRIRLDRRDYCSCACSLGAHQARARTAGPARGSLSVLPRRNRLTVKIAVIGIGPNSAYLHQYFVRGMPKVPGRSDAGELGSLLNCNPPKRSATAPHRRAHSKTPGWAGFGRRLRIICVLCHMGPSMNCMRFACRPSIWVGRSSSSVRCNAYFPANGRRLNPSNTSHAGDAMGPPRPFSPYPCRPVTRLKHHPVQVRTVARSRPANRLVSLLSRVENPRKCLPNGNSDHLRAPRAGVVYLNCGCPNRYFLCILSPRARKFGL